MSTAHRAFLAPFALASLIIVSCSPSMESQGAEPIARLESALWASTSTDFWPDGEVPMCFHARELSDIGTQAYEEQTAQFRAVAEAAFEGIPSAQIDLVGWSECSNRTIGSYPGQLRVIVNPASSTSVWFSRHCPYGTAIGDTGSCGGGAGYRDDLESLVFVKGAYYSWGNNWDTVVLHEMAHVLGFKHEWDRTDRDGVCNEASSGPSGDYLTIYDPESITLRSYCGYVPELSELDELGLEIVYPATFSHALRSPRSMPFQGGLAVWEDEILIGDWVWRGAAADAFAVSGGQPISRWYQGTTQIESGTLELSATELAQGSYTISGEYEDFLGREHEVVPTSVAVSDGAVTSVIMAML